ncbi:Os05g0459350 [Oryza sativa Japonica Group]|uniref:Os05g0459350 protein n=1 Tax=Oryza sativa subsp. japonica TaxID=39947 RepID=A0A0N7KKX0_ORYSJ|nr:Os05g0459350 [Oryza sativa Japonica Group]
MGDWFDQIGPCSNTSFEAYRQNDLIQRMQVTARGALSLCGTVVWEKMRDEMAFVVNDSGHSGWWPMLAQPLVS